jgi:hypothetical protein
MKKRLLFLRRIHVNTIAECKTHETLLTRIATEISNTQQLDYPLQATNFGESEPFPFASRAVLGH